MKVYFWYLSEHFHNIILWDGQNTYWSEEMIPSDGYYEIKETDTVGGKWIYIGEL